MNRHLDGRGLKVQRNKYVPSLAASLFEKPNNSDASSNLVFLGERDIQNMVMILLFLIRY